MRSGNLLLLGIIFIFIALTGCKKEVPEPDPDTIVKGIVEDHSGQPISGAKVYLIIRERNYFSLGKEISKMFLTSTNSNGEYEKVLTYSYWTGDNPRYLRTHKEGYLDEESQPPIIRHEINTIDFKQIPIGRLQIRINHDSIPGNHASLRIEYNINTSSYYNPWCGCGDSTFTISGSWSTPFHPLSGSLPSNGPLYTLDIPTTFECIVICNYSIEIRWSYDNGAWNNMNVFCEPTKLTTMDILF